MQSFSTNCIIEAKSVSLQQVSHKTKNFIHNTSYKRIHKSRLFCAHLAATH